MAKNAKILLLEDEPELLELISDAVSSYLPGAEVVGVERLGEAKELIIAATPPFDLLITDQNVPDGKGHELFLLIEEEKLSTRFALCSSDHPEDIPALRGQALFRAIQKPNIARQLEDLLIKLKAELGEEPLDGGGIYVPIRTRSLLKTQPLPCDVFVRIGSEKFVKLLNAGTFFEGEDLNRYLKKNLELLFIEECQRTSFFRCLTQTVLATLGAESTPESELLAAMSDSISIAADSLSSMGFSQETEAIAKKFTSAAVNVISKNPRVHELLAKARYSAGSYLEEHSVLLSFISVSFASCLPWSNDAIFLKLSLAAFLHDLHLPSSNLAMAAELNTGTSRLSADELELILNHPVAAAGIARQMTGIPPDVDSLILEHHERPDGSGFPGKLNALIISPLSALFIISHDYSRECLLRNVHLSPVEFLKTNELQYSHGSFRQILQDLLKHLQTSPHAS